MHGETLRVLLVEDNPGDAKLITNGILEGAPPGTEIALADTLGAGVDRLQAEEYDLAILDLALPDSRGIATLAAVRGVFPSGATIVLTGSDDEELGVEALRIGASDYLVKSEWNRVSLQRSIRHAVERQRLRNHEDQLHRTQKLEAVARLTFGIAHHFNNLLTVIAANGHVLKKSLGHDERRCGHVSDILQASERARELTRHLIHFCGGTVIDSTPLEVNEVLLALEPMMRNMLGARIELTLELGSDLGPVRVDRIELEQTALILLLNGRDAMKGKGRLVVSTRTTGPEADFVAITVTDEGKRRTPVREVGEGVGNLAVVHGVVQRAGGFIDARAGPVRGTSISVCLPTRPQDR
jgi:signal transduction histidine kinase